MANRLESFYSYLITTYLNQFLDKYIMTDQTTVGYQVVGFIINLQLLQAGLNSGENMYNVSVQVRTQFNRTNAGYNRTFNKTFLSPYSNLFNEDAPQDGYDSIENTVQLMITDITNALINPTFKQNISINYPPENFKVINKKR
jgi:hypothetical protein